MLDNLWNYIEANSATLITSYLGILLTLYMRRKDKENNAINAYLSNLGMYIENLMIPYPMPRCLTRMKIIFAKYYGVNIECFPIKRDAIRRLLFLYRSNPTICIQRQSRLYQAIKIVKQDFIKHDSNVSMKRKDILSWKQIASDFSISFAFLMFILSLQIINTTKKLLPLELLILIILYALFAFLTSILGAILSFVWYRIKRKYCKK